MENKSKSELETLIEYLFEKAKVAKTPLEMGRLFDIIKMLSTTKYLLDMNERVAGYFNEEYLFDTYLKI